MYYRVIEKDPDRKLRLGKIDEDGDRIVQYQAPSQQAVVDDLAHRGITEARVFNMGYPGMTVDVYLQKDGAVK